MSWFDNFLRRASGITASDTSGQQPPGMHSQLPTIGPHTARPVPQPVPIKRKPIAARRYVHQPSAPLLHFSNTDPWLLNDAFAGTHITGGNGSGKTTGSGQALAKSFLSAGFGGLVMCAKPDEADQWLAYARATGREQDVIRLSADGPWRFNFIQYEMNRPGDPTTRVENLVATLRTVVEQTGRDMSGGDSNFWLNAAEMLLRNTMLVVAAAIPSFTLNDIRKTIQTAPTSPQEANSPAWQATPCAEALRASKAAYIESDRLSDWEFLSDYWTVEFPRLADRTRSSVTFTLTTMLQDLQLGTLAELFATGSNVFPDDTHEGAIILMDLPVAGREANRKAQILFKTAWQQAALRRKIVNTTRPIFLWCDESHLFVSEYDTTFQSLARSQRACTVFLTQNLNAYFHRLGKDGEYAARNLMGFFQTQIFHAQSDPTTIKWAQELYGKTIRLRRSGSHSQSFSTSDSLSSGSSDTFNGAPTGFSTSSSFNRSWSDSKSETKTGSHGWSEQLEDSVLASHLTALKTGGPQNSFRVGALVYATGRQWRHSSSTLLYTEFLQQP